MKKYNTLMFFIVVASIVGVIKGKNLEINYDNILCVIRSEEIELEGHPTLIEEKENDVIAVEIDNVVYIVDKKDLTFKRMGSE